MVTRTFAHILWASIKCHCHKLQRAVGYLFFDVCHQQEKVRVWVHTCTLKDTEFSIWLHQNPALLRALWTIRDSYWPSSSKNTVASVYWCADDLKILRCSKYHRSDIIHLYKCTIEYSPGIKHCVRCWHLKINRMNCCPQKSSQYPRGDKHACTSLQYNIFL